VIHLAGEERLPFFGDLSIGNVHSHAADPRDPAGIIDAWRGSADAPAYLAVGTFDPEFILNRLAVLQEKFQAAL
jgi:hypothetical protein